MPPAKNPEEIKAQLEGPVNSIPTPFLSGGELDWTYVDENRRGDHAWWISDLTRFKTHYPEWSLKYDVATILEEIFEAHRAVGVL